MMKRLLDLLLSSMGLILLLPLFLVISIWIKLDSKGPVFFRQERIGRYGVPFRIFKFRTMSTDSEQKGRLTVGNDQRITKVGHFLRHYKIDELPQLIDVLRGTMSLVGPRPEVQEFVDYYTPHQKEVVLSVRPGITDEASIMMVDENQILGQYDDPKEAYIRYVLPQKLQYYEAYVKSHSWINDLKIIYKTIHKIMAR